MNEEEIIVGDEIEIQAIDRQFWTGKTRVAVADMDRAHNDLFHLQDRINRSLRHLNRQAPTSQAPNPRPYFAGRQEATGIGGGQVKWPTADGANGRCATFAKGQNPTASTSQPSSTVTLDVNEFLRALSSMNIQNTKAGNEAASMNAISTVSEDSGLWHTDVRIDNSPRHWLLGSWNWKTVASENCYLIPMNVSSKFGDTSIHKEDTVMLITPDEEWKQTGKEIRHFLIGDWESVWWKIISVLVIISTAELLLRFYFLVKVKCLVDTGSSVTVASRSLAEWLKCAIAPSKEDAISASGHTISFRGKSEFCLEIAAERVSATVYFVDEPKFSPSRDYQVLLGAFTGGEHHFHTTTEEPVSSPPRRMPYKYRDELKKHIEQLLSAGVMPDTLRIGAPLAASSSRQNTLADALSRSAENVPIHEVQKLSEMDDIVEFPVCLALALSSRIVLDPFVGSLTLRHADGSSYQVDLAQEQNNDPEAAAYIKFIESVGLDLAGPFPLTINGNKYLLNIVVLPTRLWRTVSEGVGKKSVK
ncbi:hypothetical protein GPALN_003312 [Globodera pallida]|nr:hypothetical protein GPALN_003312 [Globodera pallida]